MSEKLERVKNDIAAYCSRIEQLFVPGARVTVLVRNPSIGGDADVLVTNDADDEIIAAVKRRIAGSM